MEIENRIIVVTGAASGIGKAMAQRFAAKGALKVIAVDINIEEAESTAKEIGGVAIKADVACEADIKRVIQETEEKHGPIDLFCSNAGIGLAPNLDSDNKDWTLSWEVNVMAHVYAARHLVPRMIARGGGYFLNTASAAGLLNQPGGAAYGVTKHAAVGFSEWLALTYAHEGIGVSVLCPQAVRTPMLDAGPASSAAGVDGLIEPEDVAKIVEEGLEEKRFLILPHPEVLEYVRRKAADYDRWIQGMNRLYRRVSNQL